jgi:hypothetical protein
MLRPRVFGVEHHEPKHRLQHEERTAQRGVEPNPQALSNKEGGDIAGTDAESMQNAETKINARSGQGAAVISPVTFPGDPSSAGGWAWGELPTPRASPPACLRRAGGEAGFLPLCDTIALARCPWLDVDRQRKQRPSPSGRSPANDEGESRDDRGHPRFLRYGDRGRHLGVTPATGCIRESLHLIAPRIADETHGRDDKQE